MIDSGALTVDDFPIIFPFNYIIRLEAFLVHDRFFIFTIYVIFLIIQPSLIFFIQISKPSLTDLRL